ncbi:MAG TPA: response regulator, partial [Armatimonadota bacterium]
MRDTILVVDDDESLRAFLVDALCAAGYDVLEAGNGKEAIGLLERESVDLALVDIRMPQMSGIDLLQ